jgi:hypothetical protein
VPKRGELEVEHLDLGNRVEAVVTGTDGIDEEPVRVCRPRTSMRAVTVFEFAPWLRTTRAPPSSRP